ncbi:Crp/Fnr family transcriptional regulator [Rhodovulum sulfidophilum]|uniref:Crp/Fnr family transcriptional regulator n=1 Tax=Rhodovulum sulfidophilum TaxID=35806 RepID=UPI001389FC9A|nr:Crp/Fnr family transcriptional regulator [Rhodovulum sulfidophilum]MBL3566244.1 Crp/Fnr family transcriptional regulator [Rhodovulum sulfidophilum]MBL3584510.1 Crp/Fnr family transcriptional regulator [Rhodovulum sulfidophilum]NDK33303.1 Crp/Fnr family transcriptional regulator [Rhodovulum sulfidophilum]
MSWLARAEGLEGIEPEIAARLDMLPVSPLPKGQVLFCPGEAARGFTILLTGRVEVFLIGPTGREILLYAIEPGQSCVQSTLGLLGGEDYTGEAVTATDCEAVLVPKDRFLSLMDDSPVFRRFVFGAFAQRLQSVMALLERVAFQKVEGRLAADLLDRAAGGAVHATHQEIATRIGTAREVVSRRLDALARAGMVRLDRGCVTIEDAQGLARIAAADGIR